MKSSNENVRRVRVTGALFIVGGIALAVAIVARRDVVSLWWLAWAGCAILAGTLLLRRFRWSPELVAMVFLVGVAYTLWLLAKRGANRIVASIALLNAMGLALYPSLRRGVRSP
jgi:apolipoprotein N-acyltransferase